MFIGHEEATISFLLLSRVFWRYVCWSPIEKRAFMFQRLWLLSWSSIIKNGQTWSWPEIGFMSWLKTKAACFLHPFPSKVKRGESTNFLRVMMLHIALDQACCLLYAGFSASFSHRNDCRRDSMPDFFNNFSQFLKEFFAKKLVHKPVCAVFIWAEQIRSIDFVSQSLLPTITGQD